MVSQFDSTINVVKVSDSSQEFNQVYPVLEIELKGLFAWRLVQNTNNYNNKKWEILETWK